jgi:hypothetical protein
VNGGIQLSKKTKAWSHEQAGRTNETHTDVWLTPPYITEAVGPFDLDPCAPANAPFYHAPKYYTEEDNGLIQNWDDNFVWMNPPYSQKVMKLFMEKISIHNNGIALIYNRSETKLFFNYVYEKANSLLLCIDIFSINNFITF